MLEGCCPRAAKALEKAEPDALAYLDFPPSHWKRLRTKNVREHDNRKIKRRARGAGLLVGEFAALARGRCHDWPELEKTARKMVESSLELADRVESA